MYTYKILSFTGGAYQPHMSASRHSLPGMSLSDASMTTGAFSFEVLPGVAVFPTVALVSLFFIDRRYQIFYTIRVRQETPRHLLSDISLCRELAISQRTLQRKLREKRIDPPVGKLGKNRRGWTTAEIAVAQEQLTQIDGQEPQPA